MPSPTHEHSGHQSERHFLDDFSENVAGQKSRREFRPRVFSKLRPSTGIDPYPLCRNHASRSQGDRGQSFLEKSDFVPKALDFQPGLGSCFIQRRRGWNIVAGAARPLQVRSNRTSRRNPLRSECIRHRCLSSWLTGNALRLRKFRTDRPSRSQATQVILIST